MNGQFPLGDINPAIYFATVAVGLGLLFALIAPDSERPLWHIIIQWQLQACISLSLLVISHLLLSRFENFRKTKACLGLLISGLLGSALFTPIALSIDLYWVGDQIETPLIMELLDEWLGVVVPLVTAWLFMNIFWLTGGQYKKIARKEDEPDNTIVENHIRGELLHLTHLSSYQTIICLSAELHYLDVHTANDHQLILFSLRDAVNEIPKDLGIQIHRSHWIAWRAVTAIKKKGRQGIAIMTNGLRLPISRTKLPHVLVQWQNYKNCSADSAPP